MSQQRINYVFSAVLVVLALVLGYFGFTLPVQPEIPSPLPTPDISGLATYEDLALLQRQVETLGAQSFTVSGDDSYSTDCYQKQGGSEWIADDGCTWGVLSGGTLEVQSGATVDIQSGATMTVSDLALTGLFKPGFANVTVTNGLVITPAYTVYALDSAGAVTLTLGASASEGQLLYLIGDDANNVTVADTNIRTSTGNALVIGQYDVAAFVYQDSEWIELLLLANQ